MNERFGPTRESLKEFFFIVIGIFGIFVITGMALAAMSAMLAFGIALYCVLVSARWAKRLIFGKI